MQSTIQGPFLHVQTCIVLAQLCYAELDALKDGSSWITSESGSDHRSLSSFSFDSTVQSVRSQPGEDGQCETELTPEHGSSWLIEPSVPPPTMTEWSFPTNNRGSFAAPTTTLNGQSQLYDGHIDSCPITPALSSTQCFNYPTYNRNEHTPHDLEKGLSTPSHSLLASDDISLFHLFPWLVYIWLPVVSQLKVSLISS